LRRELTVYALWPLGEHCTVSLSGVGVHPSTDITVLISSFVYHAQIAGALCSRGQQAYHRIANSH